MQITEILSQPEGFTPPDVTVKIEKVFAYKSGDSENGPWSYQDIQVSGGHKLKLKGLPEFPASRIGQSVTIRANQSKQHGLTGMKVAHEEWNNKTYDKLVVTNSAKWDWGNNGQVTSPEPVHETSSNRLAPEIVSTAYEDHILACAALANQVSRVVMIDDSAAVQACFATVVIDTKNRGLLLPKPTANGHKPDVPAEKVQAPDEEPDDDIPF